MTVLFADVVRSMDLAAGLDPERLREIMSAVFNRSATVVQRYGGTVDKFTGDGIMALFGAPVALEDHAFRACLAALDIQDELARLAAEVERLDGVELQLRIGLNSGQVIAGDIDSGPRGYTAIGQHVGLAQRMESVAPAGGVMVSEYTARLVEDVIELGPLEMVQIKGARDPVTARRLVARMTGLGRVGRFDPTLVGRDREMSTVTGMLDHALTGNGGSVGVVGPPGIGKSRIARETGAIAAARGVDVYTTYCESHASEIPFHVVARLLREVFGTNELDDDEARKHVRTQLPFAEAEDLVLLDDLLGICDTDAELPVVPADARQRRLTRLLNTASLARTTPAVYIIEDAHWIDEVSEAMIAEFASAIAQARALMLITYRPEYRGALTQDANAHKLTLAPLDDADASALTTELLGSHPSVRRLADRIAERAAGNPFFVQEIVRDLAERGVLNGDRGAYLCHHEIGEVSVPATVQAAIAARIDRLDTAAKRALTAAAVIGSRFSADLLAIVLGDAADTGTALAGLVAAELVEQVMLTPRAEYAFRHPLIRTVAYESQLKSTRAQQHRRLATAIEQQDPAALDENAALIAEHTEAAGDLHDAFGWHMRAGGWSTARDIGAAALSWRRARQVADRLPSDDSQRLSMRIAARTLLCGNAWRIGGTVEDAGFNELRELTGEAGDKLSLAIGMTGLLTCLTFNDRIAESGRLATECITLIESLGDPTLTVALMVGPMQAKLQAGRVVETLRLTQRVIDLAGGDPLMGNLFVGSPLAITLMYRGTASMSLGKSEFRHLWDQAIAIARPIDPASFATGVLFKYLPILNGVLLPDETALRETADALADAEQSGDHFALGSARLARGIVLLHHHRLDHESGATLLAQVREMSLAHHFTMIGVQIVDTVFAQRKLVARDIDSAIELIRSVVTAHLISGDHMWLGTATGTLVEALLARGAAGDVTEAAAAIERLAAVPTDPGFVLSELPLLRSRALLARERGDEAGYRDYVDRYRARATEINFEGLMAIAETM